MEWKKNGYYITDDKTVADIDFIVESLKTTYWANDRPKDITKKAIDNSIFLSLFSSDKQIGFARIVTDFATFAWLCDVFIQPGYRGKGLGKWLCQCAIKHPSANVKLQLLMTKDAHGLYEKFSFDRMECMIRISGNLIA